MPIPTCGASLKADGFLTGRLARKSFSTPEHSHTVSNPKSSREITTRPIYFHPSLGPYPRVNKSTRRRTGRRRRGTRARLLIWGLATSRHSISNPIYQLPQHPFLVISSLLPQPVPIRINNNYTTWTSAGHSSTARTVSEPRRTAGSV